MRRRSGAAAALALLLTLVWSASAWAGDAGSVTHGTGDVTATVAWDQGEYASVANPRLAIVRAGVRYDIPIADICGEGCLLSADEPGTEPGQSILKVADLDGDGEPEVLLDTFSGGAHCCVTTRLLSWNGGGYTATDHDWRDYGYALRDADGDGRQELVGYDGRFAGAFTAFAASAPARLVLRVEHGRFVDATRAFPALLAKDAKGLLRDLRRAARRRQDVRGVLAAYVADMLNLGRRKTALAELSRQVRAHRVRPAFRRQLLRRLAAWGYPAV